MASAASASLPVGFDRRADAPPLTLEMHQGQYAEFGFVPIRLYPDVPAILRATRGAAHFGELRAESVEEIVEFSGGKTASLKRPNPNDDIAFESIGVAFDADGNPVEPALHYDADAREAVADVPFHGAARAIYTANYRLIYYAYDAAFDPFSGAYTLSAGTVYAFYRNESAQIDVGIETEQTRQYVECYRVYSKMVLDPDGAWEMPPNWPQDGDYPDLPQTEPRDPDNSFTDSRPHRIAEVNKIGAIIWRWYSVPRLQPYIGMANYKPKFFIKFADAPDKSWQPAFSRVDKAAIIADVERAYGPVKQE